VAQPSHSIVAEVFGQATAEPDGAAGGERDRAKLRSYAYLLIATLVVALVAYISGAGLQQEDRKTARSLRQRKAQAAWHPIEALGGHGVWNHEFVVVSLANTPVTDDDLVVFHDFPFVRILDLSHTAIGDNGLVHLAELRALEHLIVIDTKISGQALALFQSEHPTVKVLTQQPPKAR
jgi:hypothetical protein